MPQINITLQDVMQFLITLGVPSIVTLFIIRSVNRHLDKRDKNDCDINAALKNENLIVMRNLQAIGYLAEATAYAQKEGKTNGRMTEALAYYVVAKDETNKYLLEQNYAANH